jgi:uncharacterized protein (DUF983 family)
MIHQPASSSNPILNGLACRCPQCGEGRLFQGFLALAPKCNVCGLDYHFIDSGDGPAFFVMTFSGFIVVAAALIVEVLYQPPYWVHFALWLPLIFVTTLLPIRPLKGLLIGVQYRHKAEEKQFGQDHKA